MNADIQFSCVAVIPAHLGSVRFPRKILYEFHGLPMIEHVRRRALLCSSLQRVIVATCDDEIATVVRSYDGDVIMTSNSHTNGTSRVAEAVEGIDCSHVILLQGDEPLLLPRHVEKVIENMRSMPNDVAWNATGPISCSDELDRHSFVKAAIAPTGRVIHCFRRSPYYSNFDTQCKFVRKILGIIAYRKEFLIGINLLSPTPIEKAEYIEQMRILESSFKLISVNVEPSLPSVNECNEVQLVLACLEDDFEQNKLLRLILGM